MMSMDCRRVREGLPAWLSPEGGGLPAWVGGHLAGCRGCAAEAKLIGALQAARPDPPPDLAARIAKAMQGAASAGAVPERGRIGWVAARPVLAGAGIVAASLLGWLLLPGGPEPPVPPESFSAAELPSFWPSGSGMLAGEPLVLLEGLSEDQLRILLSELDR